MKKYIIRPLLDHILCTLFELKTSILHHMTYHTMYAQSVDRLDNINTIKNNYNNSPNKHTSLFFVYFSISQQFEYIVAYAIYHNKGIILSGNTNG